MRLPVRSRRRLVMAAVSSFLVLALHGAAAAGGATAGKKVVVRYRHAQFHRLEKVVHTLARGLDAARPDFSRLSAQSSDIAALSRELEKWFPQGSGPQPGLKTRAKPQIWSEPGKFQSAAARLVRRARRLNRAVAGHDAPEALLQLRSLGHACQDCHDQFRRSSWWFW